MKWTDPSAKATRIPPLCRLANPRPIQVAVAPLHRSTDIPAVPWQTRNFQLGGRLVPWTEPVLLIQIELLEVVAQSVCPRAIVLLRPSVIELKLIGGVVPV